MDHTNVEVGDAGKGHGRVVVKPVEVWAGSGGKQTGRDSMQKTGRLCTEVQGNRPVLHDRYGAYRRKENPVGMEGITRSVDVYRSNPVGLVLWNSGRVLTTSYSSYAKPDRNCIAL